MQRILGNGIELTIDGADEPAVVRIDSRRLDQLIGELLRNASESMRGSGEVVVRIERHDAGADQPPLIRMTFEDDGPGMNTESMRRAFEPFFTTRHHEIGIGLGLSMSHTTVNAAGGRMSLSSGDAGGLRVQVDLPPSSEREVEDIESEEIPALNHGGVGE
jgi:C4-dicarboxylate-specific signal transduction histidine kinase